MKIVSNTHVPKCRDAKIDSVLPLSLLSSSYRAFATYSRVTSMGITQHFTPPFAATRAAKLCSK